MSHKTNHIRKGLEDSPVFSFAVTPDIDTKWDASFLDPSYYRYMERTYGRGSHHSGIDVNLKGLPDLAVSGPDRDEGYPVRSCFVGKVIFAGRMKRSDGSNSGYGRVVKVATSPACVGYINSVMGKSYEVIHMVYCHLLHVSVEVGDELHAGDVVGTLGKSGHKEKAYPAHLHLAALQVNTGETIVPSQGGTSADKTRISEQFIDPALFFGSRSGKLNFSDDPTALNEARGLGQYL